MATLKELWKKGSTPPTQDAIPEGGLAIDTSKKKVYSKGADGNIFEIGGDTPSTTDDLPEGTTNLYHTDARVSDNADVAANTSARHTHSNSTVLDAITDAGSGSVITTAERDKLEIAVVSDTSVSSGATQVINTIALTQADYDALTPDPNTFYIILPDGSKE